MLSPRGAGCGAEATRLRFFHFHHKTGLQNTLDCAYKGLSPLPVTIKRGSIHDRYLYFPDA